MKRLLTNKRLLGSAAMLVAITAIASAAPRKRPPPATLPVVGEAATVNGIASWGKRDWLYDVPSERDAAGKIIVHWFCAARVKTCTDDLARIVTLKEHGRVYIVAHINGTKRQAQKLDPIRESEGVGRGTLAYGRYVTAMMKQMQLTGPASIIVGLDGKVAMVSTGASPAELDARDKLVLELASAIKEYTVDSSPPPKGVKPGDKFTLSMTVKLSTWLTYSRATPMEFKLMVPPDFKCDSTHLKGDQIKLEGQTLTAVVTCSAPKGNYEARGDLRFGYETPSKSAGLGTDGARWKFEIKP